MLSKEEVKNIAILSRIGLSEEEVEHYRHDLSRALDWFAELKEAKTDEVTPIGHITGETNYMREDGALSCPSRERDGILKNMPETKDGATKVRSVF